MKTSGKFIQPQQTFDSVDQPRIHRSGFDLSHRHTTTFDMGQVIPVALMEVIPGDLWDLGAEMVLRMQPLVAPILHPVKVKVQAWFCPNRILNPSDADLWERFITGGDQGTTVENLPLYRPVDWDTGSMKEGSLWDRFGYNPVAASAVAIADPVLPLAFPHRFYTKLWNDWFRVPGIQSELNIETQTLYDPFFENWPRDYFTSALPFLQRGVSPSLPVLGSITMASNMPMTSSVPNGNINNDAMFALRKTGAYANLLVSDLNAAYPGGTTNLTQVKANLDASLAAGLSATTNLSTVDTKQIRLAFLYQSFLERMARGGARYAEMLPNIWGARSMDDRLQRVEFIGGFTAPWLTSEVLQTAPQTDNGTSGNTTVQGTMAGHGINLAQGNLGKYAVPEHGFIMITACTHPDSAYQNGMPRSVLRRVREEFPSPAFAGLSEQEIFNAELFNQSTASDPTGSVGRTPFGYTGRYNEMRYQPSIVSSEMKSVFSYWHLGRKFTSLPPLDSAFINMVTENDSANFKRIFAVQNVPGIIGIFGVKAHVTRPIPFMAVPASLGGM